MEPAPPRKKGSEALLDPASGPSAQPHKASLGDPARAQPNRTLDLAVNPTNQDVDPETTLEELMR